MTRFDKLNDQYLYRYCGWWGRRNLIRHVRNMLSVKDALKEYEREDVKIEQEQQLEYRQHFWDDCLE